MMSRIKFPDKKIAKIKMTSLKTALKQVYLA